MTKSILCAVDVQQVDDTKVLETAERNSEIRHLVATGSIYEEILEVAKKTGADLIVIGAHQPHLSEFLLGPNAARVVRHSKCSVYVVRN